MSSLRDHGSFDLIFGDGSDGDVTITASFSMTRDMFYDHLTIDSANPGGATVWTNSYRLHARRLLFTTDGTIACTGSHADFEIPGDTPETGSLASGGAGATGSVGTGAMGFSVGASYGGSGGDGGTGAVAGAQGGAATVPRGSSGSLRQITSALLGYTFGSDGPHPARGGGGGGSGGGSGVTTRGGAGGAGGGVLLIAAKTIEVETGSTALLTARGGDGGSGEITGGDTGGGGGGGGGVVILVSNARPPMTTRGDFSGAFSIDIDPGQGGPGADAGTFGAPGSSGSVFYVDV